MSTSTVKTERRESDLHVNVTTNPTRRASTSQTMHGVQQGGWPFLAASPNLLQSYARLAFPDMDPQTAQLLGAAHAESQAQASPNRLSLLPPPFAGQPVFAHAPNVAGAFALQSVAPAGDPSLVMPHGAQMDPATIAALGAAAAAYQQMNGAPGCQFDFPGGARRKNATRETTSTLKAWLHEHRKNPYPTKAEKIMLAILTRMSLTQVSTWFANARRRLKKESKMNSWTASQQSRADGQGGKPQGASGSDNSLCEDSDEADFDGDSIDIDGECGSDGEAGAQSSAAAEHPPCHQFAAATTERIPLEAERQKDPAKETPKETPDAADGRRQSSSKIWSLVDTAVGTDPSQPRPAPLPLQGADCQELMRQYLFALSASMQAAAPPAPQPALPPSDPRIPSEPLNTDPLASATAMYLSLLKHRGTA